MWDLCLKRYLTNSETEKTNHFYKADLLCFTWAQVGHGGGQLQVRRVVRCDADFDGTRPLVHHLVDANLEHLVGAQRAAAKDHAVVEVIGRAVKAALLT